MNHNICMPDYANSVLGVPTSILKHYGVPARHASLSEMDAILARGYKNVVMMIFDGFGSNLVPADGFTGKHKIRDLSSVFPCTTAVSTMTLYSGMAPIEHGWMGWACNVQENDKCTVLFTARDFYSGDPVSDKYLESLWYKPITMQVADATGIKTHGVFPEFLQPVKPKGICTTTTTDMDDMFEKVKNICNSGGEGRQFILSYWPDPDFLMHGIGTMVEPVKELIAKIDAKLKDLAAAVKDTLIIVTADHGHIDVTESILLNDYPDILDCLTRYPSLELRTVSFDVKPEKAQEFQNLFNKHFGADFILMPGAEYISRFLGPGAPHPRVSEFIGDFIAIATGGRIIQYHPTDVEKLNKFKGYHGGLTEIEMKVPLIVIET